MSKIKKILSVSKFKILVITLLVGILIGVWSNKDNTTKGTKSLPEGFQKPNAQVQYDIAVIGSGAAGSMATYRGVLNNDTVLFAIGAKQEQRRSRGRWVPKISNNPLFTGIERPIIYFRNITIKSIVESPLHNNLYVLQDSIIKIHKEKDGTFTLSDGAGVQHHAKHVILATGMTDEQPHIQDSIEPILHYANSQQAIYCLRCDGHLIVGKNAVVVFGHDDGTAQNAMLIKERYDPPTLSIVTNGVEPTWSQEHSGWLKKYNIETYTQKIIDIKQNNFNLEGFELSDSNIVPANIAVINLGVRINNQLAKDIGAQLDDMGYVLTDENGLSSISGLYAAGDLRANSIKQVYSAWANATASADAINRELRMNQRKKHE